MAKISLIGAGSVIFTRLLTSDCFSCPELAGGTFVLYDIDPERLVIAEAMTHKIAAAWQASPTIIATTDPRVAFDGG